MIAELRASDLSELSIAQRRTRDALLDELERYAARGVFPANRHSSGMAPTFIDETGNRCAVAHLLESTGDAALAARVARTHNAARVHELAADSLVRARLGEWLARAGITVAEAARIQPTYCDRTKPTLVSATHRSALSA